MVHGGPPRIHWLIATGSEAWIFFHRKSWSHQVVVSGGRKQLEFCWMMMMKKKKKMMMMMMMMMVMMMCWEVVFCDVDVYYTYTVFCWNIPMAWVRACDLAGSTWPLPLQYWSECWLMARRFFSNQKASPTLSSSRTLLGWVILVYTVGDEILPSHVEIFHQPI